MIYYAQNINHEERMMGTYVEYSPNEIRRLESDVSSLYFFVRVLNNLPLALFGSNLRAEILTRPYADEARRTFRQRVCPTTAELPGESDRALGQTPREWYADVDEACRQVGYSIARVQAALKVFRHRREVSETEEDAYAHFAGFLLPVYVALRKMGYNPYDILG